MQAQHLSNSDAEATTSQAQEACEPARRLLAIQIIGTALFDYQISKSQDSKTRVESLTNQAQLLGDLTASDAAIVAELLAKPITPLSTHLYEVKTHG
ncbi:hypothetical protein PSCICL_39660 [Pseudomonas cichorii]|nr:hypothetical protein PSCICL_39660 [Pseudomonas cichorii]